jgi:hypothetical protein
MLDTETIQSLAAAFGGAGGVGIISAYVIKRLLDALEEERATTKTLLLALAQVEESKE